MMTEPMLSCSGLGKTYDTAAGRVTALREVALEVRDGEFTAIVGPSGSGKTTLLSLLGGLEKPSSGGILIQGEPLQRRFRDLSDYRRRQVGIVFQAYNLVPHLTAIENVMLPMELAGTPRRQRRNLAAGLLESMGIPKERFGHRPLRLSGGEQQRVAMARALANTPPILLADEPTGNLDEATSDQIVALLRRMTQAYGLSVVLVTHNPRIAARADHVVRLNSGQVESDQRAA
jgi:putative ABC transport system ATP-binding protein